MEVGGGGNVVEGANVGFLDQNNIVIVREAVIDEF